jgi:hypothetical protein
MSWFLFIFLPFFFFLAPLRNFELGTNYCT